MSAATKKSWFDVDKEGLAKILERRGKEFLFYELISNAWDTNATEVKVNAVSVTRSKVQLTVEDDDPEGFKFLSHAFTLFAESEKKGDAELRGRFNLGEKLVLAMCDWAEITTTTGTVRFDEKGRTINPRMKRERGSIFIGSVRMTKPELGGALKKCELLICSRDVRYRKITTTINGSPLPDRIYLDNFEAQLPTEIADVEGNLRRSERKTRVEIYSVLDGETAMIYEMGIPIVETGDAWHVNIMQKVPLSADRDNVTPAYLAKVRALVLNAMAEDVTPEMASEAWVRDAAAHVAAVPEAVTAVMTARFGNKRVSYDPSDPEANKLAVAAGYTVVHGGSLSSGEWANARKAEALLPAGKVTPSPRPFSPDGAVLHLIVDWSHSMKQLSDYANRLAQRLIGKTVIVQFTDDRSWKFNAAFSTGVVAQLTINLGILGENWFENGPTEEIDRLLLHEFAHAECSDHLDDAFAEAGFRLGAKLKRLALDEPEFFRGFER